MRKKTDTLKTDTLKTDTLESLTDTWRKARDSVRDIDSELVTARAGRADVLTRLDLEARLGPAVEFEYAARVSLLAALDRSDPAAELCSRALLASDVDELVSKVEAAKEALTQAQKALGGRIDRARAAWSETDSARRAADLPPPFALPGTSYPNTLDTFRAALLTIPGNSAAQKVARGLQAAKEARDARAAKELERREREEQREQAEQRDRAAAEARKKAAEKARRDHEKMVADHAAKEAEKDALAEAWAQRGARA